MLTQAPKGTKDLFGADMRAWQALETVIRELCEIFGFSEIRTPTFEHTELFQRGVGETTDVVQKEMYTFLDKGGRSISLRPEMTAGVARAYVENGMHVNPQPTRLFYIGPNFRYEAPQSGRLRQHHQFGVELFGANGSAAEAEIISLGYTLMQRLGIAADIGVYINSLGCTACRQVYHAQLKAFLGENLSTLCPTCQTRFAKNPLRVLDCKEETCKALMQQAPLIIDALDEECRKHFDDLQRKLQKMDIPFTVAPKVVRGLDYYTRTVFEFIPTVRTQQTELTVIGGGRYDGLITECGGNPTGAAGFGMGLERLLLFLKALGKLPTDRPPVCAVFIGHAGEEGADAAQQLVYRLRLAGITAENDIVGRSVKAQMKYANKLNAAYAMIIGGDEIANGTAALRCMDTGEQQSVALNAEAIAAALDNNKM